MMMTFDKVIKLKKEVSERFDIYLHFHDGCGSQYFSFDEPIGADVKNWLTEHFAEQGIGVVFSGSDMEFALEIK